MVKIVLVSCVFLCSFLIISASSVHAEGSFELMQRGSRSLSHSFMGYNYPSSYTYVPNAIHIYAKEGEHIYIAGFNYNGTNGLIMPDGSKADVNTYSIAALPNDRTTEGGKVYPNTVLTPNGERIENGYISTPYEVKQTGIYSFNYPTAITYWDITVTDENNKVINGRVYTDYSLSRGTGAAARFRTFAVTRDGYIWEFDKNGTTDNNYHINIITLRGLVSVATNTCFYHSASGGYINYINNQFVDVYDKNGNSMVITTSSFAEGGIGQDAVLPEFFNPPASDMPKDIVPDRRNVGKITNTSFEGTGGENVTYVKQGGNFSFINSGKDSEDFVNSYSVIIDMSNMYYKPITATTDPHYQDIPYSVLNDETKDYNFIYTTGAEENMEYWAIIAEDGEKFSTKGASNVQYVKLDPEKDQTAIEEIKTDLAKPSTDRTKQYISCGRILLGNACVEGKNEVYWNGRDEYGRALPSGEFFGITDRGSIKFLPKAGETHFIASYYSGNNVAPGVWLVNSDGLITGSTEEQIKQRSKVYYNHEDTKSILTNRAYNVHTGNTAFDGISTYEYAPGDAAAFEGDRKIVGNAITIPPATSLGNFSDMWSYLPGQEVSMQDNIIINAYSDIELVRGFVFYDETFPSRENDFNSATNGKNGIYTTYRQADYPLEGATAIVEYMKKDENNNYVVDTSVEKLITTTDEEGYYDFSIDTSKFDPSLASNERKIKISVYYAKDNKIYKNTPLDPSPAIKGLTKENGGLIATQELKFPDRETDTNMINRPVYVGFAEEEKHLKIEKEWRPKNFENNMKAYFHVIGKNGNEGEDSDGKIYYQTYVSTDDAISVNDAKNSKIQAIVLDHLPSTSTKDGGFVPGVSYALPDLVDIKYEVEEVSKEEYDKFMANGPVLHDPAAEDNALENYYTSVTNPDGDYKDGQTMQTDQYYYWKVANEFNCAAINEFVWFDSNGNGKHEENETGIENATVKIYKMEENTEATTEVYKEFSKAKVTCETNSEGTTEWVYVPNAQGNAQMETVGGSERPYNTDPNGNYTCAGLTHGKYKIEIFMPDDYVYSTHKGQKEHLQTETVTEGSTEETTDSEESTRDVITHYINLQPGQKIDESVGFNKYGDLVIDKTVSPVEGASEVVSEFIENATFAFDANVTVYDESGRLVPLTGEVPAVRSEVATGETSAEGSTEGTTEGTPDTLSFDAGHASFTLKDGEQIDISLPSGSTYTIKERDAAGFKFKEVTVNPPADTQSNTPQQTGTLIIDEENQGKVTVNFVNDYLPGAVTVDFGAEPTTEVPPGTESATESSAVTDYLDLKGIKTIEGRSFEAGDSFNFIAEPSSEAPTLSKRVCTLSVNAENVSEYTTGAPLNFNGISAVIDAPGTYQYTLHEEDKSASGKHLTYDNRTYIVEFEVVDGADGYLKVKTNEDGSKYTIKLSSEDGAAAPGGTAEFVNTYFGAKLKYDMNGGTYGQQKDNEYIEEFDPEPDKPHPLNVKPNIRDDGFVFLGWTEEQHDYIQKNGQNKEFESSIVTEVDVSDDKLDEQRSKTVYALWAEDSNNDNVADYTQVKIEYYGNGGIYGDAADPHVEYAQRDPEDNLSNYKLKTDTDLGLVYENYVFMNGWLESDPQNKNIMSNGENAALAGKIVTTVDLSNESYNFENPKKVYALWAEDNYSYNGWETPPIGHDEQPPIGHDKVPDYKQIIFYGNEPDDALTHPEEKMSNLTQDNHGYDAGDTPLSSAKPQLDGYAFKGWAEQVVPYEDTVADTPASTFEGIIKGTGPEGIAEAIETVTEFYQPGSTYNKKDGLTKLYAAWHEFTHHVLYNANNGENVPKYTDRHNFHHRDDADVLDNDENTGFSKDNAVFIGWTAKEAINGNVTKAQITGDYEQVDGKKLYRHGRDKIHVDDFDIDNQDNNIDLYAVWADDVNGNGEPDFDEAAIKYVMNGGKYNTTEQDHTVKPVQKEAEHLLSEDNIKPDSREGYKFLGWTKEQLPDILSSDAVSDSAKKIVTAVDTTLATYDDPVIVYALWAADSDGDGIADYEKAKVEYYANNGDNSQPRFTETADKVEKHTLKNNEDENISLSYDGFTFLGWTAEPLESILSDGTNAVNADQLLKDYTVDTRNATYDSPVKVYALWAEDKYNWQDPPINNDDEKFKGPDGTPDYKQVVYFGNKPSEADADLSVDGIVQDENSYEPGDTVTLPGAPVLDGYIFKGWAAQPNGEPLKESSVNKEAGLTELYAIWEVAKYKVIYHANNGTADFFEDEIQYAEGTEVTIKENQYSKDKAIFLGWTKNEKFQDILSTQDYITKYTDSVTIEGSLLYSDKQPNTTDMVLNTAGTAMDLYAVWAKDEVGKYLNGEQTSDGTADYMQTVYEDGFEGAIDNWHESENRPPDGTAYKIPDWKPEREGYVFEYWVSSATPDLRAYMQYNPGEEITPFPDEGLRLKAEWASATTESSTELTTSSTDSTEASTESTTSSSTTTTEEDNPGDDNDKTTESSTEASSESTESSSETASTESTESSSDTSTETSTNANVTESTESTTDESDSSTETTTDESTESTSEPVEGPTQKPDDDSTESTSESSTETSTNANVTESTESTTDESESSTETSTDESTESTSEPAEGPTEKPTEESTESSSESSTETSTNANVTESSTESSSETSTEGSSESTEISSETTSEETTESSSETSTEESTNANVTEASTETSTETSTESSSETSTESSSESSTEESTNANVTESSTESSSETSTESSSETSTEGSTDTTNANVTETSTKAPDDNSDESSTENSSEASTEDATGTTNTNPNEESTEGTTDSAEGPTQKPGENSSENSSEASTEDATGTTDANVTESSSETSTEASGEETTDGSTDTTDANMTETSTEEQSELTTDDNSGSEPSPEQPSEGESSNEPTTEGTGGEPGGSNFRLHYDGNGATGGSVPNDDHLYPDGTNAELMPPGDLSRPGAAFVGWSLTPVPEPLKSAEEAENAGIIDDGFVHMDGDVTVYAVWAIDETGGTDEGEEPPGAVPPGEVPSLPNIHPDGIPDYKQVVYDLNYSTDSIPPHDNHEYSKGDTATVVDDTPSREGYTFAGWATDPEAEKPDYRPGDKFTLPDGGEVLYAVWEPVTEPKPDHGKGNSNGPDQTQDDNKKPDDDKETDDSNKPGPDNGPDESEDNPGTGDNTFIPDNIPSQDDNSIPGITDGENLNAPDAENGLTGNEPGIPDEEAGTLTSPSARDIITSRDVSPSDTGSDSDSGSSSTDRSIPRTGETRYPFIILAAAGLFLALAELINRRKSKR